jgi:lysine 2,3-aminomutase
MNIVQKSAHRKFRKKSSILAKLIEAKLIDPADADACEEAALALPIGIPKALFKRIEGRHLDDPLVKQFVPTAAEGQLSSLELSDPIGDRAHSPVPGIVHRYRDRVLLMPVLTCPVYCRFCFRRNQVGDGRLGPQQLKTAFEYIAAKREIWEVILSGGDPLLLTPKRLSNILESLEKIPHVGTIRIHTRVPALDPDRVSDAMLGALNIKKPVWVVLHCNHADEIDERASDCIARIVKSGIPMLSQTVLLKGINDNQNALISLMRTLIQNRIKPYYLHHADLAEGTSHFRTTLEAGRNLMRHLRKALSGIARPAYVLDTPGGRGKVPAEQCWINPSDKDSDWWIEDLAGVKHLYSEEVETKPPR